MTMTVLLFCMQSADCRNASCIETTHDAISCTEDLSMDSDDSFVSVFRELDAVRRSRMESDAVYWLSVCEISNLYDI